MNDFFLAAAQFLLLTVAAGLVRVLRGPTAADRMLAAHLFGTTGVAVLLLLAQAWSANELRDVALVFTLLAAVVGLAFARRGWAPRMEDGHDSGESQ
jgi:multicomponent Na+:H+ antiporter subunit F